MHLNVKIQPCRQGDCLPLLPAGQPDASLWVAHHLAAPLPKPMPFLGVGTSLCHASSITGASLFTVTGHIWLPTPPERLHSHARGCPLLTAQTHIPPLSPDNDIVQLHLHKRGYALAWVTLSDRGVQGVRADVSGPAIAEIVKKSLDICFSQGFLLPDDPYKLRALLMDLAVHQGFDIICTTGGTGVSPRDRTPQGTLPVLDYTLPGLVQAMLLHSLKQQSHAAISRMQAGVLKQSLVINLPGSQKGVEECLEAVMPILPHLLEKLHGDTTDCGA